MAETELKLKNYTVDSIFIINTLFVHEKCNVNSVPVRL